MNALNMITPSPWNLPFTDLPADCDVLVIGCGPAGSACARTLALAGLHVVMVDTKVFPRDKTCGDGLVPDTHAALRSLGLLDEVLAVAKQVPHAQCVAPNGRFVDVPGELAVLPRRQLDALLCQGAVRAGARMFAPAKFDAPLSDAQGRVMGASLRMGSDQREVRAKWVVLATGAAVQGLQAANMCLRRGASGMALRTYIRHEGLAEQLPGLRFTWHQALKGGYGWIFPGPDHTYNIGVAELGGRTSQKRNLRDMFNTFQKIDPLAGRLAQEGQWQGDLAGAPLRCDLDGATWHRPGLLLAGDAMGATYAFTGEGIGKALETGLACAHALIEHVNWTAPVNAASDIAVMADHQQRINAMQPPFKMYQQATSFNRHPWLLNPVIWRAQRSARIQRALSDILAERRHAGSLISWRGLKGMLWG